MSHTEELSPARFEFDATQGQLCCLGSWTLAGIATLERQLSNAPPDFKTNSLRIDGSQIQAMDSAGAWLLYRTRQQWTQQGLGLELQQFDTAHLSLMEMMHHYMAELPAVPVPVKVSLLASLGQDVTQRGARLVDFLAFIGEICFTVARSWRHPSRIRWHAIFANLNTSGVQALPIVGLMAFLMGIVIAYQGGVQLSRYGANILIVELVGVTLLRELSPLLTAIIIAGRSGSAYTAQIGTMRVTDELDALRTMGIPPSELLVLPKLFAMIIVLPLLTAFSDILGIFGGMMVAKLSLGVSFTDFIERLPRAVSFNHYLIGIGKAPIFAAIIALIGCYQGLQVHGGADSVGKQVTISVVQAIFFVILADAFFSILFSALKI